MADQQKSNPASKGKEPMNHMSENSRAKGMKKECENHSGKASNQSNKEK